MKRFISGLTIWCLMMWCGSYFILGYDILTNKNNTVKSSMMIGVNQNPFKTKIPGYNKNYRNTIIKTGDKRLSPLSKQGVAVWLGQWNGLTNTAYVKKEVDYAKSYNRVPTFVVYAMPYTKCSHGVNRWSGVQYKLFINSIASGLKKSNAAVILEPDSLSFLQSCSDGGKERVKLLQYGVKTLSNAGVSVYLDAGHSNWHSVDETVRRINKVGVNGLRGFSLNVSNYQNDNNTILFGSQVARKTGLHFIYDSSRNGVGQPNENEYWCNGNGRIGRGFARGTGYLDARLWIKPPGESDGYCKGGPQAGVFWKNYALRLVK